MSIDVRVAAEMKKIFEEIPGRLSINAILTDAHLRLSKAIVGERDPAEPQSLVERAAESQMAADKLVEVLREIATYAVDQFTRRTGQQFLWVDEPEFEPNEDNVLMHFSIDAKGNVVF